MSQTYERKLEQFKTKLQQSVALADDEIVRLNQYLSVIRMEMVDINDQINRYQIQYEQDKEAKIGTKIKEKTKKDADLARLTAEHHAAVQDLYRSQTNKIAMMQSDYENALKQIEESANRQSIKAQAQLDNEIKKLQLQLGKLIKHANSDSDAEEEEEETEDEETKLLITNQSIEEAKIQILEDNLKQRQSERLSALNKNKAQLDECLNTLEELEQEHINRMEKFKDTLADMDVKHKKKLSDLQAKHEKALKPINKKLTEETAKGANLQTQISKIEEAQARKLAQLVAMRDSLKSEFNTLSRKTVAQPNLEETHELAMKSMTLRSTVEQADSELSTVRAENMSLKQEIGRLRHVARINNRRMRATLD